MSFARHGPSKPPPSNALVLGVNSDRFLAYVTRTFLKSPDRLKPVSPATCRPKIATSSLCDIVKKWRKNHPGITTTFQSSLANDIFSDVKSRRLNQQQWSEVRLEYETSVERPTLRQLAVKHCVSRSTIFKRAAREHWKQNATIVDAARKQIVQKMEVTLEAATTEAAQVAAKEMVAQLQPWIEREKAEHIRRVVRIVKHGFQRIERLWDENAPEVRSESLAAATLDKHDAIIRRNLGMNESQGGSGTLDLYVSAGGGRRIVAAAQKTPASG
jgi:hypothetical protein